MLPASAKPERCRAGNRNWKKNLPGSRLKPCDDRIYRNLFFNDFNLALPILAAFFTFKIISPLNNLPLFFSEMQKRQDSDGQKIDTPGNKREPSADIVTVR